MDYRASLTRSVEAFLARHGMSVSAFGRKASGNHKLLPRLMSGMNVTHRTLTRVEAFMHDYEAQMGDERVSENLERQRQAP